MCEKKVWYAIRCLPSGRMILRLLTGTSSTDGTTRCRPCPRLFRGRKGRSGIYLLDERLPPPSRPAPYPPPMRYPRPCAVCTPVVSWPFCGTVLHLRRTDGRLSFLWAAGRHREEQGTSNPQMNTVTLIVFSPGLRAFPARSLRRAVGGLRCY